MINPLYSVLYGELVLSLYPLLIKTVNTNIYTQVLARFLVFPILALFSSTVSFRSLFSWSSIFPNILNMIHVFVSYYAFKILPIGIALTLFYLYPFFNVIASYFLFGESVSLLSIVLIMVSLVGVYLIATSNEQNMYVSNYTIGIVCAIVAAITETMIYVFVRSESKASPFYAVSQLYPFGLLLLVVYGIFNIKIVDVSMHHWMKLIGFNALLGFTGYIARFYSMPKITATTFSLLSFFGVAFGYLWGKLFTNDIISNKAIIGSLFITTSIAILRYFE